MTDLQRHVLHAVRDYTIWKPLEVLEQGMTLTPGSRSVVLTPLASLIRVLACEYPVDVLEQHPRELVGVGDRVTARRGQRHRGDAGSGAGLVLVLALEVGVGRLRHRIG